MIKINRINSIYFSLLILRFLISINSKSFIHPDEFFQNGEIISDLIFNFNENGNGLLFKSWEWLIESPSRSLTPILTTIGTAFFMLKQLVGESPSAYQLFIAQRLWMFCMSLIIDGVLWKITKSSTTLLLYASSPLVFTFLLRPFSNSIETLLFVIAILTYTKIVQSKSNFWNFVLGSIIAFGIFTRVTFLAFVLPLVIGIVLLAFERALKVSSNVKSTSINIVKPGITITLSFVFTSFILIIIDSTYFSNGQRKLILTPLNSLLFNMSTTNLAEHGIHPRYLHFLVNLPMLFGAGVVLIGLKVKEIWMGRKLERKEKKESMDFLYLSLIILPTLILSIFPHQEPRFLLPLIIPVVILIPTTGVFKSGTLKSKSYRRLFWIFWIIHSILFTTLFGFLHQGGLVPTLLELNNELITTSLPFGSTKLADPNSRIEFIFWKTFMPPRHLLIPPSPSFRINSSETFQIPFIQITDLSGSTSSALFSTIQNITKSTHFDSTFTKIILVAPSYSLDQINFSKFNSSTLSSSSSTSCSRELFTKGFHFDMDRLDEMFEAKGGWTRLGLSVVLIDSDCNWDLL